MLQSNLRNQTCKNLNLPINFSETVENYPTNFNSIVNSNIIINRLYLEVSIPSLSSLNNTATLTKSVSLEENNFSSKIAPNYRSEIRRKQQRDV